jgi:NTE family protein
MSGSSSVLAWSSALEDFALFRTLSSEQRLKTLNAMVRQDLVRGQMLVAQGGPSDSLFLVLHGALAVRKTGYLEPIAELRAGELVGEIGFFANVPRTADVVAIRDTSVLALTRPAYQRLVEEAPAIVEALLAALARRFAKETARIAPFPTSPKARTVALIDGGLEPLPGAFDRRMREGLAATSAEIVDAARLDAMFPAARLTHTKSPNGSTSSSTRRRWWFISRAATPRPGHARPSARPTWSCSRAAGMRLPSH